MNFVALDRFLRLGLSFSMFSGWVWPEMKKVAGDGLARNGGSLLGQQSPVSAVVREVREKKKKKTKTKTKIKTKTKNQACVR
jgi:hypothetical protein